MLEANSMLVPCQSCRFKFKLDSNAVKTSGTLVRCSNCHTVFRVYPPEMLRYRKHTRIRTQNLISYFAFNKNHRLISHGLGIAVDISQGGILLETPSTIESSYLVLTAVDKQKKIIEAQGRLIYSKKASRGTFLCGIEFIGSDERVKDFITKLVLEYSVQRNNLFIKLKKKLCGKDPLPNSSEPIPPAHPH